MAPRCLLLRCCGADQVRDKDRPQPQAQPQPQPRSRRRCTPSCQQPEPEPSYNSEPLPSCKKLLRKRAGPSKVSGQLTA